MGTPGVDTVTSLRWLAADLARIPKFARLAPGMRRIAKGEVFPQLLAERVRAQGDSPALHFPEGSLSWAELDERANRVAAFLREAGAEQGDPVAVMIPNSAELLLTLAAMTKLGTVGALVNTHLSGQPLRRALETSGARLMIVDPQVRGAVDELAMPGLRVAEPADAEQGSPAPPPPVRIRARDTFLFIYSSGTTGVPKPARITYATHAAGGLFFSTLAGITADDVVYAPLPLYHGQSNIVGFGLALRTGAGFVSRRQFSASEFLDDVGRHGVTAFVYVGELCRYLLARPERPGDRDHGIRVAIGAGLRPDVWPAFQSRFGVQRIVEVYGETEGNISLLNLDGLPGSVGRPPPFEWRNLALVRYDVERAELARDDDGFLVPCGFGEPGLLLGRLGGGMRADGGYVHERDREERIVRDAFVPGDRWYRSSDLLRRDRGGNYFFVDRVGDTFRWKGENVSTQEVAEVLSGHPSVREAVVYGVPVPGADGQAGMAALVVDGGFEPAALSRFVADALPTYAQPLFLRLTPEIETTGTLKPRKVELRAEGYDLERVTDPIYLLAEGAYVRATPDLVAALGRR
jgi:fatty-acyl-CoA synthase